MTIRPATPDDAELLVKLILELADYERMRDEARPDAGALRGHLTPGSSPRCEAFVAETAEGEPVGFALFFQIYSTFLTNWGVYLEDLYVKPEYRGQGIGFALLKHVAEVAVTRKAVRLEWQVLNWNDLAINFYRQIGARPMDEWTTMRLTGEALATLGGAER